MREASTPSRVSIARAVSREIVTMWSARRACAPRERRVVAPDLRARPLRMIEKVEIVDRDEARGAARGNEQRVRRVHDVERAAGQLLDRRPLEPVPREVQQRHRDAPIDEGRAGNILATPGGPCRTTRRASATRRPEPTAPARARPRGRIRRRPSARGAPVGSRAGSARAKLGGCYHAKPARRRKSLRVNRLTDFRAACYV